ncbi:hypothetical protein FD07_GL000174 [Levilactobacillus parabrevis ATCC 53295]|uniref:Uncharacterized protein n=2 Tax=Levilactobacillus parabrevis TaxID=357278 RepID=A0A0R1GUC5_9LACO|nr:hypothetical protein FD07_GL000174 [Levilactobacillus parabrevis ATCC 53295]KRO05305.1 hypothetical protein IV61_GL001431 [Levilactobacillus parabrevis]
MSDEEAKRWRKIVFMDDDHDDKRSPRSTRSYVYSEPSTHKSWWHRLKGRLTRR